MIQKFGFFKASWIRIKIRARDTGLFFLHDSGSNLLKLKVSKLIIKLNPVETENNKLFFVIFVKLLIFGHPVINFEYTYHRPPPPLGQQWLFEQTRWSYLHKGIEDKSLFFLNYIYFFPFCKSDIKSLYLIFFLYRFDVKWCLLSMFYSII